MPIDPELADELVATVRAFVVKDVLPLASDLEHADEYPTELVAQMRALGLFGATIPVEHGGLGLDVATYARIVEELADRKSTRLNSSHQIISYAVFCLKKKKKTT